MDVLKEITENIVFLSEMKKQHVVEKLMLTNQA